MSDHILKSDKVRSIVKQYDDAGMFDKLSRADAEDSRNIVCAIFNIDDALNASSVVRGIQTTARLFGVEYLQTVQTRMLSANWEGDVCEFALGEESNLSVKVVAEVVPSGNRVWNIILEADSKMCHLTYLLGHITKSGQQASFKILNMINRTDKDYIPEPDPNKVVLRAGKMIELRFADPNDDINTEIIIDPAKGKSKVTLKEHVVTNSNTFIVLKDVTNGELEQGFEHLVKDGFVMEQKKILSRGEIVTVDGIADLLTSRLPGGLNINLTGFDGKMYVVVADVFVNSFLKEGGTITPEDIQTECLDDAISLNEAVSVNIHTEEGSVTDEYKAMHPDSVFEELANGVIVEYVKPAKPAPLAASAPEPEPVQEEETKEETPEEPSSEVSEPEGSEPSSEETSDGTEESDGTEATTQEESTTEVTTTQENETMEEQKEQEAEEQLNEIGTDPKDLPPKKSIESEHTVNEFLQILFGTSSPTILHIFKMLNKYGKTSQTYQLTQTFPTIVDIVFTSPAYHYSIVRMKNGCYYKVFVAHTELERENHGCWEDTNNEPGRWMHLINVSDRQVNDAFRGRL